MIDVVLYRKGSTDGRWGVRLWVPITMKAASYTEPCIALPYSGYHQPCQHQFPHPLSWCDGWGSIILGEKIFEDTNGSFGAHLVVVSKYKFLWAH